MGSGATGLGSYGLSVHSGSVPGAIWFAWLSEWTCVPGVGAVVVLALVYPSGRLLSARWRPVALAAVLLIVLLSFGTAVGPWTDGMFPVPRHHRAIVQEGRAKPLSRLRRRVLQRGARHRVRAAARVRRSFSHASPRTN